MGVVVSLSEGEPDVQELPESGLLHPWHDRLAQRKERWTRSIAFLRRTQEPLERKRF